MAPPKAIFFDLDDTLISAYARPEAAWDELLSAFGDRLDGVALDALRETILRVAWDFWGDPERHRYWRQRIREARRQVVRRAFVEVEVADAGLADEIADAFSAHRERNLKIFPDTHDTLVQLRDRGLRLALVTNGASDSQWRKIERFDLQGYFEHILVEGDFGAGKPEDRVYRHLLEAFGLAPEAVWMVGDNLEWEVAAPQRHGITGIWCNRLGDPRPAGSTVEPDHEINRLSDLLPLAAGES
jgi:putative hydrolase of the HAD superfamily